MTLRESLGGFCALNIVMIVLSVVATALRFWLRAVILKRQFGLDDWLCLAAMFPIIALGCTFIYMARHGVASAVMDAHLLKTFFACCILFSLGLGFTKLSLLALYRRYFGNMKQHDTLSWAIPFGVALVVHSSIPVLAIFLVVFRCHPVSASWNRSLSNGGCVYSISTYLLVVSAVSMAGDVILIVLPIPRILELSLPRRQKVLVAALLIFSASVPLVCIGRVVSIVLFKNRLDGWKINYIVEIAFWFIVEPSMSIVAISIPHLFRLAQLCKKHGYKSFFTGNCDAVHVRKSVYQRSGVSTFPASFPTHLSPPIELVRHEGGHVSSSVQVERGTKPLLSPNSNDGLRPDAITVAAPDTIHVKREFRIRYDESTSGSDS